LGHENQLFEVIEAAVNQPLDLARFDPPAPAIGTVVHDTRPYWLKPGVAGAPPAAGANSVGGARSPGHSPPPFDWRWWAAALLCLLVVFLAARPSLRRRK